jgi:polyisoprenoid-binding protein YceI
MSDTTTRQATRLVDGIELPVPGTYLLDPVHTNIGFSVRHLMVSRVRGRFTAFSGTAIIGDDPLDSSVTAEIEMASIDTADPNRDAHLRSPDFFDVEKFPTMTYRSTAVRPAKDGRWKVDGELTLHGITRPESLDVSYEGSLVDPYANVRAGFSASADLNREDFGLTWNQPLDAGGVMLGRMVTIEIDAEAILER